MSALDHLTNCFIPDPALTLRVWVVRHHGDAMHGPASSEPVRWPAYTPTEALQAVAAHSIIPRAQWGDHLWTVEPA